MIKMSEAHYAFLREENAGICLSCKEENIGGHEPDAENYECESCGASNSQGIETLLIMGLIEIE